MPFSSLYKNTFGSLFDVSGNSLTAEDLDTLDTSPFFGKDTSENQVINSPEFSSFFRETCCVFQNGDYWYAKGYHTNKKLLDLIATYRRKNIIPKETLTKSVDFDAIAKCYDSLEADNRGESEFLYSLLETCASVKASDLIIIEGETSTRFIAMVNDFEMELCDPKLPADGENLINLLFSNRDGGSNHDGLARHKPQGFSLSSNSIIRFPKNINKLRLERGPVFPKGQHCVARIFYTNTLEGTPNVRNLGFDDEFAATLENIATSGRGLIVFAAPTGEGKSTTLATLLKWLSRFYKGALRIVTVEDPPEYVIEGVTQTSISNAADGEERDRKFKEGLNSFVRVHPTTGMIGEIRDLYSALQALAMVRTGHQIFTTMHETSANGILFRLMDEFGITPAQLSDPHIIALLVRQTLTTLLCPDCCLKLEDLEHPLTEAFLKEIHYSPSMRFRNETGCSSCIKKGDLDLHRKVWSGYSERKAIAEYIRPDERYLVRPEKFCNT